MERSNPFTRNTTPHLFDRPSVGEEYRDARHAALDSSHDSVPAPDSRYPAFAAATQDGRLVTDYRPQCTKNIRTGAQFQTKMWMIHHAESLMEEARQRHVERTGASLPMAQTVPPPAAMVHSTPFTSEVNPTGWAGGIGVERADAKAPSLFGTFSYEPTLFEMQSHRKNIAVTTREEGGRNSKRGRY